jgi:hypothetical protein
MLLNEFAKKISDVENVVSLMKNTRVIGYLPYHYVTYDVVTVRLSEEDYDFFREINTEFFLSNDKDRKETLASLYGRTIVDGEAAYLRSTEGKIIAAQDAPRRFPSLYFIPKKIFDVMEDIRRTRLEWSFSPSNYSSEICRFSAWREFWLGEEEEGCLRVEDLLTVEDLRELIHEPYFQELPFKTGKKVRDIIWPVKR